MPAILATLLPLIPGLVQFAERALGGRQGKNKLDVVVQAIRLTLSKLAAPDTAGAEPVTDDLIRGAVEAVLAQMRESGSLAAPSTVPAGTKPTVHLIIGGTVVTYNAKESF